MTLAIGLAAMFLAMAGIVGFLHAVWIYEMREELHDIMAEVCDYDSNGAHRFVAGCGHGKFIPRCSARQTGFDARRSTTLT